MYIDKNVARYVPNLMEGGNVCIVAGGQTGAVSRSSYGFNSKILYNVGKNIYTSRNTSNTRDNSTDHAQFFKISETKR